MYFLLTKPLALCLCAAALLTACSNANVVGTSAGTNAVTRPAVTLAVNQASISAGGSATLTWASTQAAICTASGGWSGTLDTSGTQTVTPGKTTSYSISCTGGGNSATADTTVTVALAANAVQRPDYNTGTGFFVLNGKLYDPDGLEFRIRGVNRNHYDSKSEAGIAKSGANATRVFVSTQFGESVQGLVSILQTQHVLHQQLAIPANSGNAAGQTTCVTGKAALTNAVNDWVAGAGQWTTLDRYMVVNVANEWGPRNSTGWRDQYISAIAKLRAAGYTSPLMIDSGGCGQDQADLLNYAADVFSSDPQKNIIFSFHAYGGIVSAAEATAYFGQLKALQQSAGLVFVVGEFGPGRNIGPSPTLITPGEIIVAAEGAGLGWLAWAWDDNNLGGCKSNDSWFSMTYNCGLYTQTSDLTLYGKDVVLNPTYGLQATAQLPNW